MGTERLRGVRLRSAVAAAVVVAVTGLIAAAIFIASAEATLTRTLDDAASQRADDVAAALRDDGPDLDGALGSGADAQSAVQVLTPGGVVLATSISGGSQAALTTQRPPAGRTVREERLVPALGDDTFRLLIRGVSSPQGPRIVVVAQSQRPLEQSREAFARTLLWGMPALALVVGLATFVFVGRSLRPVEAIRRQVAGITAARLRTRVPVPPARDEVAALAVTMNSMLDRLENAADAQRRFVADASHELRSPLATIQVGLDHLARSAPAANRSRVERLQAETARLGRLVSDLLLLARADEDVLTVRHDDVDLDDLVYAERERLQALHPQLTIRCGLHPVRVSGDAARLERALRNLGDNAARHAQSTVTVQVWQDDTSAHLTVADDGPGIALPDRTKVFERFVRLDDSRSRGDGGSGLGLPISREIVLGHGGQIEVDNAAGGVLHVRLPLQPPSAASR